MGAYVDHLQGARRQDWGTPQGIFDSLNERYRFDLDGASDGADRLVDDFASDAWQSWVGRRVFCNPPWSSIPPFIEKAAMAECAVLLVPARVNARWFHRALDLGARVEYFLGKPKFRGGQWNSPVDCLLLVWGS